MKKIALRFPSKELMAEFILVCKFTGETDPIYFTLTSNFEQECIDLAINQYQACIAESPDFIIPR